MLAARFHGDRRVTIEQFPDPEIQKPDECLVRVMACGICGSDKRLFLGDEPTEEIMGHEMAGEIIAVGDGVSRLRVGDRVVVFNLITCGQCAYCAQGRFTYCTDKQGSVNGGYGELLVAPERNLWPLPDDISYERGCLFSDVLGTPHKALRLAGVGEGDTVVIFGCGPIGLAAAQIAVARGARVMSVDMIDYRLEAAARMGAEVTVNAEREDPTERAFAWTKLGADFAFDCTGDPSALLSALETVRPGGRTTLVGANQGMQFNPWQCLSSRDVTLGGTWYLHLEDYYECLRLYRTTAVDPLRILTHQVPLEDIARGFELFCDHKDGCLKVVVLVGLR